MDDFTHLLYHQSRERTLMAEAAIRHEVYLSRLARRRRQRESVGMQIRILFRAFIASSRAARSARRDAWLDGTRSLRDRSVIRIA